MSEIVFRPKQLIKVGDDEVACECTTSCPWKTWIAESIDPLCGAEEAKVFPPKNKESLVAPICKTNN